MPLEGEFGSLQIFSIERMPNDRNLAKPRCKPCDPGMCPLLRSFSAEVTRAVRPPPGRLDRPRQSDRPSWVVEPAWVAAPPRRVFGLGFVAQLSNLVVFWLTTANPANSV
jgi:hypothetical protein